MVTHDPHAAEYASHVINLEEADLSNYKVGAAA
jgi:ABC-type lipoprotein export system ATPase subunit